MRRATRAKFVIVLIILSGIYLAGCRAFPPRVSIGATPAQMITDPPENPVKTTETLVPSETPTPTLEHFEPFSLQAEDCDYGGAIKAIEALERHTVRFSFCEPQPAFLTKIAFPAFAIQSKEWLEETGGGGPGSLLLEKPVGTGPYRVKEWTRGEEIHLTAFETYWDDSRPHTSDLIIRWSLDASQRLLELQTGTVDGIDNVGLTDFTTIQENPDLALYIRSPLNIFYVGINNAYPPFDQETVRQALAMGIDRQKIVKDYFPPGYEVAAYFTPCTIPDGCEGEPWYEFDPDRARQLLAEAGFPLGFKTELAYRDVLRGYLPRPDQVAREVQRQLKENLGVEARLVKVDDSETFFHSLEAGEVVGLHLLGWGADYPDTSNFLDGHFGVSATRQFGDPFTDIIEALQNAALQPDSMARQPYYQMVNNAIKQHVPMIPISHGSWAFPESLAVAFKRLVSEAHASPFGFEDFSILSIDEQDVLVWMQSAEPLSLYCADETDVDSLRACAQVTETLYRFEPGGVNVFPGLAEHCISNEKMTVWTCKLRENVLFHDGSLLDANDVAISWIVQWDATHPLHQGNTGAFDYFEDFWVEFLNAESK